MKIIIALFLTVTMILAITIVVYAETTTKAASTGNYSLSSRLKTDFHLFAKDNAEGTTVNTTEDPIYWDSRVYVYLQALDSKGVSLKTTTHLSEEQETRAYLSISCKAFRVKSYLMEPVQWKCRLSSAWLKHTS